MGVASVRKVCLIQAVLENFFNRKIQKIVSFAFIFSRKLQMTKALIFHNVLRKFMENTPN